MCMLITKINRHNFGKVLTKDLFIQILSRGYEDFQKEFKFSINQNHGGHLG